MMVEYLSLTFDGQLRAQSRLARAKNVPTKVVPHVMQRWGRVLARDTANAARQAGVKPFTGTLFSNGMRWEQAPQGKIGRFFIRQYGVYLDSMSPHWVNITPRRTRLLAWAMQSRNGLLHNAAVLIASGKLRKKAVFVRPHPYILTGYTRARSKLMPMIRQEVSRELTA